MVLEEVASLGSSGNQEPGLVHVGWGEGRRCSEDGALRARARAWRGPAQGFWPEVQISASLPLIFLPLVLGL